MKKETNQLTEEQIQKLNFFYGKAWENNPSMYLLALERNKVVRQCDYCGKDMTADDVENYGTLCERCYNEEYYN